MPVDAPDIQRLLKLHGSRIDTALVREYFRLFEKEDLLDEHGAWCQSLNCVYRRSHNGFKTQIINIFFTVQALTPLV
jgi:hypothetical protein